MCRSGHLLGKRRTLFLLEFERHKEADDERTGHLTDEEASTNWSTDEEEPTNLTKEKLTDAYGRLLINHISGVYEKWILDSENPRIDALNGFPRVSPATNDPYDDPGRSAVRKVPRVQALPLRRDQAASQDLPPHQAGTYMFCMHSSSGGVGYVLLVLVFLSLPFCPFVPFYSVRCFCPVCSMPGFGSGVGCAPHLFNSRLASVVQATVACRVRVEQHACLKAAVLLSLARG